MIILGIDPGTAIVGYGAIKKTNNKLGLIDYGCIKTDSKHNTAQRLKIIDQKLEKLIKKIKPQKIAVEDIFFFKNQKTAISVSQARGVILCQAAKKNLNVFEYTPLQVKQAVSGYGRADKKQVQQMTKLLLNLKKIPKPDDAADALAIAICCAHTKQCFQSPNT
jgi:crossover junction endodeoxyribonuclease RuvC